jgi:hypothetical protein
VAIVERRKVLGKKKTTSPSNCKKATLLDRLLFQESLSGFIQIAG